MFHEPLIRPLAELERIAIVDALIKLRGDKPAVARALGVSLKTLYNKLHEYGLPLDYARPVVNVSVDSPMADALTVSEMR